MKRPGAVATAVAVCVMALTVAAWGQTTPAPAASESATPLTLHAGTPIELSRPPSPVGLGWKLFAAGLLVAGGVVVARKRMRPREVGPSTLKIVRRAPIGLRSELLVVEVEGQRLLLGVTASSIQQLATLEPCEASEAPEREGPLAARFTAMLDAADRKPQTERSSAPARRTTTVAVEDDDAIPGQARGLLRLGGR